MRRTHLPETARALPFARLALGLACAFLTAGSALAQDTLPMQVQGANLRIERPAAWRAGGIQGYGILHHYIATNEGLPSFSVQTDAEARVAEGTPAAAREAQVEALFEAIAIDRPGAEVMHAGWQEINGLRVHDSLSTFRSMGSVIVNRRVIIVHDDQPYIFAWSSRQEEWAQIEKIVQACVSSLRAADPPGTIAD